MHVPENANTFNLSTLPTANYRSTTLDWQSSRLTVVVRRELLRCTVRLVFKLHLAIDARKMSVPGLPIASSSASQKCFTYTDIHVITTTLLRCMARELWKPHSFPKLKWAKQFRKLKICFLPLTMLITYTM